MGNNFYVKLGLSTLFEKILSRKKRLLREGWYTTGVRKMDLAMGGLPPGIILVVAPSQSVADEFLDLIARSQSSLADIHHTATVLKNQIGSYLSLSHPIDTSGSYTGSLVFHDATANHSIAERHSALTNATNVLMRYYKSNSASLHVMAMENKRAKGGIPAICYFNAKLILFVKRSILFTLDGFSAGWEISVETSLFEKKQKFDVTSEEFACNGGYQ